MPAFGLDPFSAAVDESRSQYGLNPGLVNPAAPVLPAGAPVPGRQAPPPNVAMPAPAPAQPDPIDQRAQEMNAQEPGRYVAVPADQVGKFQEDFEAHQPNEFIKGLESGLIGNATMAGNFVQAVGVLSDSNTLWETGQTLQKYGKRGTEGKEAKVPSIANIRTDSIGNLASDIWHYAEYQAGNAVGSSAPSLATGTVAGVVGTFVSLNPVLGVAAGAATPSFIQNAGDLYGQLRDSAGVAEQVKAGKLTPKQIATYAMIGGVPMAALDIAGLESVLGVAGFSRLKKGLVRRIVQGVVTGSISEGTTEGLQQVIEEGVSSALGDKTELKQRVINVLDSAIGGALGGGLTGGAAHAVQRAGEEPAQEQAGGGATPVGQEGAQPATAAPSEPVNPAPAPIQVEPPAAATPIPGAGRPTEKPSTGPMGRALDTGKAHESAKAAAAMVPPGSQVTITMPGAPPVNVTVQSYHPDGMDVVDEHGEVHTLPMDDPDLTVTPISAPPQAAPVTGAENAQVAAPAPAEAQPATEAQPVAPVAQPDQQAAAETPVQEPEAKPTKPIPFSVKVGENEVAFPDDATAALYDLGQRRQTFRQNGRDTGKLDTMLSDLREHTAKLAGIPVEDVNKAADDYRHLVERMAKGEGPHLAPSFDAKQLTADRDHYNSLPLEGRKAVLEAAHVMRSPKLPWETLGPVIQNKLRPHLGTVDAEAHGAATSPHNEIDEPTEAQKEAGNYAKGHLVIGGLDLSIENPKGSTRSGVDADGKAWHVEMRSHYGYARGTVGYDKDHVDVFVKPGTAKDMPDAAPTFVVDQNKADGTFDEHKVMVGYGSADEARAAYLENYAPDWKGLGAITETTFGEFKQWARSGEPKKGPFGKEAPVAETKPTVAEVKPSEPKAEPEQKPAEATANVKWFGSRGNAQAYIERKKIGATHEIVAEGRRFEVRPKKGNEAPGNKAEQFKPIGVNSEGVQLHEDGRGVRSYLRNGVRITESVRVGPRGEIATNRSYHPEFLTADEASESADGAHWWRKELTEFGRRQALEAASLPEGRAKVMWDALTDAEHRKLNAIRGTDRDPARAVGAGVERPTAEKPAPKPVTPQVPAMPGTAPLGAKPAQEPAKEPAKAPEKAAEPPKALEPEKPAAPAYGAQNKLVTADRAEELRNRLRAKLKGQLNSGIDPEILAIGTELAVFHIEAGARKFADFAQAIAADMGTNVAALRRFLRAWYNGARDTMEDSGLDVSGMDSPDEVRAAIAELTAEKADGSGAETGDRAGVSPPQGGREHDSQHGAASAHSGQLEEQQSEDVGGTAQSGSADGGQAGVRPATENVQAPEGTDGRRDAVPGRAPSGGRTADVGRGDAQSGRGTGESSGAVPAAADTRGPVGPANPGRDFVISDPERIVGGGPVARFDKNKAAIELRNELLDSGLKPTPEQQETLAGYTGWGSFGQELFQGTWSRPQPKPGWEARDKWLRDNLGKEEWEGLQRSIINAHYTDPTTVRAMWDMVRRAGFAGGRVLEPSIGVGNFFGLMPADLTSRSKRTGIELDPVTGSIAQLLYPAANIQIKGFEQSKTPDNFYDLVIGNWPFADVSPADRRYNRLSPNLHDYFFLKALDQTRPGGLVVGITSAGTMDKKNAAVRRELARKGELIAAFRLPSGAFENYAGTKVVTDIIILRKRAEPLAHAENEGWIRSEQLTTPAGEPINVNQYYHANPDHVLGTLDYGHGTTTFRPGMIVHRPADLEQRLRAIIERVPEGAYLTDPRVKQISYIANHTNDRTGALVQTKDGFYVVQGEHLAPANEFMKYAVKSAKETARREAQLGALVSMRKLYGALMGAQRSSDATTERTALRKAYEAFVKEHGRLNESFGLGYLDKIDDPFYPALAALEQKIEGKNGAISYKPAAILTESTVRGAKRIENPSISDAFVLARNEAVDPSPARIAEFAGKPEAEVRKTLIDSGAAFEGPSGEFIPSDIYLAGNVREKMRQARAALDEGNKSMQRNIDALQKVMPADVPYFKIETQLGATWVPPDVYRDYIAHMLGLPNAERIEAKFQNGGWHIDFPSEFNHRAEAQSGFGHPSEYVRFKRLVRAAMANQTVTIKVPDGEGGRVTDEALTKEANAKISDMRMKFGEWLWQDPNRRVDMEREYNEVRNAFATAHYDGSFLSFQGMALSLGRGPFDLRQHQANAIWQGLVTRKTLNAHEVGTGKTFTIGGIAVESRRYGIAKKPVILAHNANSKSVAIEIQQMYPAAKVLYVDNLSKENVKTRMLQIANDDWDAIVLPHSLIDRIGFKEETLMSMAQEELDSLAQEAEAAAEEEGANIAAEMWEDEEALKRLRAPTAKQLVKQRLRVIQTIRKLAQRASREDSVAFEDMGIDMVLVDEAHEFKKPPIATRMKMKGLQKATSDRSIALMFLTKYIRAMHNGGNVHLFSGTPVTNTMTEVFHQMRYIMDEEMKRTGLADWDGWFGSFAREVEDVELTSTGSYEPVTRLQAFINVPELRRMIGQYMSVVFSDDMPEMQPRKVNGKTLADSSLTEAERAELINGRTEGAQDRPYKKVVNSSADMTPEQTYVFNRVQQLANQWKNMGGYDRLQAMRAGSEVVPIIHDQIAEKASFDVRLVDAIKNAGKEGTPEMAPHPASKPARAIKGILEIYKSDPRATQVVFMEQGMQKSVSRSEGAPGEKSSKTYPAFSTMYDMIERLVQAGIPRSEIAVVTGSTSKDRRAEIAQAMNEAKIRLVFGSTDSLGVGVNMQRNLRAMHHMDAPWMPGDLAQRNGRGHRQGNQWNTVLEYRYLTDRLDGRRWQVLSIKQKFINDFLTADDSVRVIEGDAASDEQSDILSTFSEAAGDPRILIREKLKKKVEQLLSRERVWLHGKKDAERAVGRLRRALPADQERLEAFRKSGVVKQVSDLIEAQRGDNFRLVLKGSTFDNLSDADDAVGRHVTSGVVGIGEKLKIGTYGGQPLYAEWSKFASKPDLMMQFGNETVHSNGPSLRSLQSALRALRDEREGNLQRQVTETQRAITHNEAVVAEPFHLAESLADQRKKLADLERDIERNPVAPPYWLRSGAPVETDVYWKGEPYIVAGHRWTNDGFFVSAEDKSANVVAIPYLEAKDKQGMPLYTEHKFAKPKAEGPQTAQAKPETDDDIVEGFGQQGGEFKFVDLGDFPLRRSEPIGQQAQAYVVERGRATGLEHMVAFDKDGNVVAHGRGTQGGLGTPQTLLDAIHDPDERVVVHHNHPSNSELSRQDITMLARPGLAAVWAHGHEGARSRASLTPRARRLLRDTSIEGGARKLRALATAAMDTLKAPLQDAINARKIGLTEAERALTHFTLVALHRAGIIDLVSNFDEAGVVDRAGLAPYLDSAARVAALGAFNDDSRHDRRAEPVRFPGDMGTLSDDVGGFAEEREFARGANPRGEADDRRKAQERAQNRVNPRSPSELSDAVKALAEDARGPALMLLPLNTLVDWAAPDQVAVKQYVDLKRAMDAFRNKKQVAADQIIQKWRKVIGRGGKNAKALADLMHASTLAGVDPSITTKEERAKGDWAVLRQQFEALSPAAQALFGEVRDAYKAQAKELDEILLENVRKAMDQTIVDAERRHAQEIESIRDQGLEGAERDKAIAAADRKLKTTIGKAKLGNKARFAALRKKFEENRVPAPYFPLARFGQYFVTVRNDMGKVISFSRAENKRELNRLVRQMRAEHPDADLETGVLSNRDEVRDGMDPRFMSEISDILGGAKVDDAVMDQIWQRYLETMPDLSTRKRFIHRKGVAGFNQDALRAFGSHMFHAAHQMARVKFGSDLGELVNQAHDQARKAPDRIAAGKIANELEKRHEWVMNPTNSSWATAATTIGFLYYLGASPASAAVNLSQTVMLGVPILGSRFGMAKSIAALGAAMRDFVAGKGGVLGKITGDEKDAIQELYDRGALDQSQAHDLAGVSERGAGYNPTRQRVMQVLSFLFHQAERFNREVTALAAYRLARGAGMSNTAAIDKAADLTWMTHFDYTNTNRPRVMQRDAAKVLLLFKNFQINMWYRLFRDTQQAFKGDTPQARREARMQLAGIMGMFGLMAGSLGVPLMQQVVIPLFGMMFGDDDDDKSALEQFRTYVLRTLGPQLGGMVLDGVPGYLTGTSLTQRIGMADLWFQTDDRVQTSEDWWDSLTGDMLGPLWGMMHNVYRGYNVIRDGKGVARGVEMIAPTSVRNLLRAWRYSQEGVVSMRGDQVVPQGSIDVADTLKQALGFTPAEVSEQYQRNTMKKNMEKRIGEQRKALLDAFARAVKTGDDAAREKVLARIQAFNAVPLHAARRITSDTIRDSMRTRNRLSSRAENGVIVQNKRLNAMLNEQMPPRVYH